MAKPKAYRLDLKIEKVKEWTQFLINEGKPFNVSVSNYTTSLISEEYNIKFLKNMQSLRAFAAAAKIKKEVKEKPLPNIDMKENKYFDTGFKGNDFYSDKVFNIDLKSAYSTILFNDGFISAKTFNYISKLKKQDRLTSLGMLASRKRIFYYNSKGKETHSEEIINPLSNFFFYCVQKTENIISEIKHDILQDAFLFSWVDGIYFNNPYYSKLIQEYLNDVYKMKSTFKELSEFEVKTKSDIYRISFFEEPEHKKKSFAIPIPETNFKKELCDYLLKKDYSQLK